LVFSCRERAGSSLQKSTDLARAAVNCNTVFGEAGGSIPSHYPASRHLPRIRSDRTTRHSLQLPRYSLQLPKACGSTPRACASTPQASATRLNERSSLGMCASTPGRCRRFEVTDLPKACDQAPQASASVPQADAANLNESIHEACDTAPQATAVSLRAPSDEAGATMRNRAISDDHALRLPAERLGVQRAAGSITRIDQNNVLLLLDAKIAPIPPLRCNAVFGRRPRHGRLVCHDLVQALNHLIQFFGRNLAEPVAQAFDRQRADLTHFHPRAFGQGCRCNFHS